MPAPRKGITPSLAFSIGVAAVMAIGIAALCLLAKGGFVVQRSGLEITELVEEAFSTNLDLYGTLRDEGNGNFSATVKLPASQVDNVYAGEYATVTPSQGSDFSATALVVYISDQIQPDAVQGSAIGSAEPYHLVSLVLDSLGSDAVGGMEIKARIQTDDLGTAFGVPQEAVGTDEIGQYVVAVYADGSLKQIHVTQIGTADDGRAIIQSSMLTNGMTIRADLNN